MVQSTETESFVPPVLGDCLESLVEPSLLCHPDGRTVWGNLAARGLLGLPEGVCDPAGFLVNPETLVRLLEEAEAARGHEKGAHRAMLSIRFPSREVTHLSASIQPLCLGQSGILWWLVLDMAGHSAVDTGLALLRGIENITTAVYLCDRNGRIRYVNRAFEAMTGQARDTVLGADARQLRSNRMETSLLHAMWAAAYAGQPWQGQVVDRRPDGGLFDSDLTILPLLNPEGLPEVFFCVQRDMTGQRWPESERLERLNRLETSVRRQEEELGRIREISQLLHEQLDREETLHLILIAVTAGEGFRFNRAFLLLADESGSVLRGSIAVGPANQEEAGRIWSELSRLPQGQTLRETLRAYRHSTAHKEETDPEVNRFVQELVISFEQEDSSLIHALREERPLLVNQGDDNSESDRAVFERLGCEQFAVLPMLRDHRPVGAVIVDNAITRSPINEEDLEVLDLFAEQAAIAITNASLHEEVSQHLTEREVAYAELESQHQRLAESEKLADLGKMAAIVAHEIRTPLACIGGYARGLARRMPDDDAGQGDLAVITEEVQRLEQVVEDLLYYAKPRDPKRRPTDINQTLEGVLGRLEGVLEESGLGLDLSLDPTLPSVRADERLIRQVLINVIGNAVESFPERDFTSRPGGQPESEGPEQPGDRRLSIQTHADDGWITIAVRDSGDGIPERGIADIQKAFVSSKPRGTGLGLYISKRIMDDHNGTLKIRSEENVGTTVTIGLPVHDPQG